jgi:predicted Fe-Mo cluster-binding NifX family protein
MCYTVLRGVVVSGHNIPLLDGSFENLPSFFREIEADVIITGSISDDIRTTLESRGFTVIANESGDPLSVVQSYL